MSTQRGIVFEHQAAFGIWFGLSSFFLGLGAGLFILSVFYGFVWGKVAGLVFVVLDLAFLGLEAGHPFKVWRAFSRPGTAWLSRGLIGLCVFFVLAILAILQGFKLLPWTDGSAVGWTVNILAVILAAFLMVYSAMVLAGYPSIPAWNTGLLPTLFISYGLTGGAGVLYFLRPLTNIPIAELGRTGLVLVAINLVLLLIYWAGMASSTTAARESAHLITRGSLWPYFIIGVIIVGLLAPLVIAGQVFGTSGVTTGLLIVGGVLILAGNFIFRYVLLKIGIYEIPR